MTTELIKIILGLDLELNTFQNSRVFCVLLKNSQSCIVMRRHLNYLLYESKAYWKAWYVNNLCNFVGIYKFSASCALLFYIIFVFYMLCMI